MKLWLRSSTAVGAINESDVTLAATSNAIIIGFNVRPDSTAKQQPEREGVDLRLYRVITMPSPMWKLP